MIESGHVLHLFKKLKVDGSEGQNWTVFMNESEL